MIDTSAFIGNWPFRPLPGSTPDTLAELLKAEGIERALVSTIEGIFYDEPHLANEELFEALKSSPNLIPAAVLNPKLSNWRRNLGICHEEYNIRALKLHPNYHHYDLSDAVQMLDAAGERNLPVIVQMRVQDVRAQKPSGIIPDLNIADVIEVARAHPATRFVIGGIRWGEAMAGSADILELANLWLDISQIEYTDCLRRMIRIYGTTKLLFGTHAPFFVPRSAILKLQEAELSEEERKPITAGNAGEIFSI